MSNPFILKVIPPDSPFCNRTRELKELSSHVHNYSNVVLFSPRRYGKTSLVKKLQFHLLRQKVFSIYTDFFMVDMVNDVAARIAKSVYALLDRYESLLKKGSRYLRTIKGFRPVLDRLLTAPWV